MQREVIKNRFDNQSFYVGIDYHKKSWKVTILGEEYEHKSMSQDPRAEILVSYLQRNFPGGNYLAVYEAGFSGFGLCRKLNELGVKCSVIHPADVPTSRKEKVQKTDRADSRKLARCLRSKEIEFIDIPSRELEADRALIRQRYRIVKDVSRTKNRIKSLLFEFGIDIPACFTDSQTRNWSKNYLRWLKELDIAEGSLKSTIDNYIEVGEQLRKKLLEVNRQVRKLSQTDKYKKNLELLIGIPGISTTTAMAFLVQLGDIRRFKKLDELCNYVGLVPSMHTSGDKIRTGKIIKRGRKELKIMLIEVAWNAVRKDPALMHKFTELSSRMHKNKAIIRIARKILSRIRFVLLNQQPYELGITD